MEGEGVMIDVRTTVPVAGTFDLDCQSMSAERWYGTYVVGVHTVVIGFCSHDILIFAQDGILCPLHR